MSILFIAKATITMSLALGFVIIYVAYIVFVIAARYIYQSMKMQRRIEEGIARLQSQNNMERGLLSESSAEKDHDPHHIELPKAKDDWGYSGYNSYVVVFFFLNSFLWTNKQTKHSGTFWRSQIDIISMI